ncbi:hypothetical protein [Luteibaculum oceani]|uniref:Uncharacterized protein n=1 Tax=Luteibaculum oceani TaxID=1294296 RepID=A0A5C6V1R1_9FLAO|nr:hypothetical protein [Luteibaculum oceani]TXC78336.1 hypothetical protein FRX97_08380 [Luteibaculum oceani]
MKKLLILLLLIPMIGFAEDGHNKRYFASLEIHNRTNINYEVIVDGVRYDMYGSLFLNRLRPGSHHIRVIEHRINRRGYGYAQVVFADRIFLPHGAHLEACIDRFGDFRIQPIRRAPRDYCRRSCNMRHDHHYHPDYYRNNDDCNRRGKAYGRRGRGQHDWDD